MGKKLLSIMSLFLMTFSLVFSGTVFAEEMPGYVKVDYEDKDTTFTKTVAADEKITEVIIKASNTTYTSPNLGSCYGVVGLGTKSVTVTENFTEDDGSGCHDVSNISYKVEKVTQGPVCPSIENFSLNFNATATESASYPASVSINGTVGVSGSAKLSDITGVQLYLNNVLLDTETVSLDGSVNFNIQIPEEGSHGIKLVALIDGDCADKVVSNTINFTTTNSSQCPLESSLEKAVLVSPIMDAEVQNNVTLDWNSIVGATSYTVEIADSEDFSNIIKKYENLTESSVLTDFALTANNVYYWRVMANKENCTSSVSDFSTFVRVEQVCELPSVVLVSPIDGATNVETSIKLDWDDVAGAEGYMLMYGETPEMGEPIFVEASEYNLTNLKVNTKYYWAVQAVATGSTNCEPVMASFTTKNSMGGGNEGKVTICHITGRDEDRYEVITVDDNAVDGEGHRNHEHDGYYDIIPIGDRNEDGEVNETDCYAPPVIDDNDDDDDNGGIGGGTVTPAVTVTSDGIGGGTVDVPNGIGGGTLPNTGSATLVITTMLSAIGALFGRKKFLK